MNWRAFPGGDLVADGLADLAAERETAAAALVSIGAPRLRTLGLAPARVLSNPERRLYELLAAEGEDTAHGRYNALVHRLVSFERAVGVCSPVDRARIERVMEAFGRAAEGATSVFLVGGSTAVLEGWRDSTVDIDFVVRPEDDAFMRELPALKERLQVSLGLESPLDFIPVLAGWEDRSPLIRRIGMASFHHFDPYAQALSKIERGHTQDRADVLQMLQRGFVNAEQLRTYFESIDPLLYRFPAIDPPSFRRAVEELLK